VNRNDKQLRIFNHIPHSQAYMLPAMNIAFAVVVLSKKWAHILIPHDAHKCG